MNINPYKKAILHEGIDFREPHQCYFGINSFYLDKTLARAEAEIEGFTVESFVLPSFWVHIDPVYKVLDKDSQTVAIEYKGKFFRTLDRALEMRNDDIDFIIQNLFILSKSFKTAGTADNMKLSESFKELLLLQPLSYWDFIPKSMLDKTILRSMDSASYSIIISVISQINEAGAIIDKSFLNDLLTYRGLEALVETLKPIGRTGKQSILSGADLLGLIDFDPVIEEMGQLLKIMEAEPHRVIMMRDPLTTTPSYALDGESVDPLKQL